MAGSVAAPSLFDMPENIRNQALYMGLLGSGTNMLTPTPYRRTTGQMIGEGMQGILAALSNSGSVYNAMQDKAFQEHMKLRNADILEEHYKNLNDYYKSTAEKQRHEDLLREAQIGKIDHDISVADEQRGFAEKAGQVLTGGKWIEDVGEGEWMPDEEFGEALSPEDTRRVALSFLARAGKNVDDSVVKAINPPAEKKPRAATDLEFFMDDPKGFQEYMRMKHMYDRSGQSGGKPRTANDIKKEIRGLRLKKKDADATNEFLKLQLPPDKAKLLDTFNRNDDIDAMIQELEAELEAIGGGGSKPTPSKKPASQFTAKRTSAQANSKTDIPKF